MPRAILPPLPLRTPETTSLRRFVTRLALTDICEFLPRGEVGEMALVFALRCFLEFGGAGVVGGHGFVGFCHFFVGKALGLQCDVVGGRGDGR
jgi:hypothetical protein